MPKCKHATNPDTCGTPDCTRRRKDDLLVEQYIEKWKIQIRRNIPLLPGAQGDTDE